MSLIFATGLRPGSDTDTKAKLKAYGATTLEGKHVITEGDNVSLQFTGKKGVSLNIPVENKEIAAMLKDRANKAGANKKIFAETNSSILLAYVHGLDKRFKVKDFRTHLANKIALEEAAKIPLPQNKKEYAMAVKKVATAVSNKLGNTPKVARESYIDPSVWSKWEENIHENE
jgi:DNA topoisomerase-1